MDKLLECKNVDDIFDKLKIQVETEAEQKSKIVDAEAINKLYQFYKINKRMLIKSNTHDCGTCLLCNDQCFYKGNINYSCVNQLRNSILACLK